MTHLDQIEALLAETTGWLEWISPKATTEIAVVFPDGSAYLPTGGTEEEFAFANAQGNVRRLVRAEDVAPLAVLAREVEALHPREDHKDSHGNPYSICGRCLNSMAEHVDWPCPTAAAIQRLGGA